MNLIQQLMEADDGHRELFRPMDSKEVHKADANMSVDDLNREANNVYQQFRSELIEMVKHIGEGRGENLLEGVCEFIYEDRQEIIDMIIEGLGNPGMFGAG